MREVVAVAVVSLLTGITFGVAGSVGPEQPSPQPSNPGVVGLEQAQNPHVP